MLSLMELCADTGLQFLFMCLIQGKMHVRRFKPVLVMPSKVSNLAVEDKIPLMHKMHYVSMLKSYLVLEIQQELLVQIQDFQKSAARPVRLLTLLITRTV